MFLKKWRRRLAKHSSLFRSAQTAAILLVLIAVSLLASRAAVKFFRDNVLNPKSPVSLILGTGTPLKSDDGRTNFLLLGIGDETHDGPNLSDTMIVVSVPASGSGTVYLVSVPRDIYLDDLGGKINSAYADGQAKEPGAGLTLAKAAVTEVTGLPIHYGVRADFSGFARTIDILGGVDIDVENTFDDYYYPIDGHETDTCGFSTQEAAVREATAAGETSFAYSCRYEHVHFDKGLTHMDGATALKYVRSRHAEGTEGTDFARSRRQERLIVAVKTKALALPNLLNPQKILEIYTTLKDHLDTDIDTGEFNTLLRLGSKLKGSPITTIVLDQTLLANPPMDGRGWILLPTAGNWDQVHSYLKSQLQ